MVRLSSVFCPRAPQQPKKKVINIESIPTTMTIAAGSFKVIENGAVR